MAMHRAHSAEVLGATRAHRATGEQDQRTQSQRHTRDRERKSPIYRRVCIFGVISFLPVRPPTRENALGTHAPRTTASRASRSPRSTRRPRPTRGRTDPPRSRASSARASPSAARHASCSPRLAALPRAPSREEAGRHEGAEAGGEGHGVRGDPAGERRRGGGALVRVRVRVRVRVGLRVRVRVGVYGSG